MTRGKKKYCEKVTRRGSNEGEIRERRRSYKKRAELKKEKVEGER